MYPEKPGSPAWTVGKLIELIDEAIDTAGAQLARSAGLWADSPTPFDERERPIMRRRKRSLPEQPPMEEPAGDRDVSLM